MKDTIRISLLGIIGSVCIALLCAAAPFDLNTRNAGDLLTVRTVDAQTYGGDTYGGSEYGGDVIAPTLSSAVDASTGQTTGSGAVTTNEANGTLYFVVTTSATTPSAAQVAAGQNHTGAAAVDDGSQTVSSTGAQNTAAAGLTANTGYFTHFMHEDAIGNQSGVVSASGFTTDTAPDITAPVLSAPTDGATGQTSYSGTVTTDEGAGTLYFVVTTSATTPSAAQVAAGQDHAGAAAPAAKSQAVIAVGSQPAFGNGLIGNTTYYIHYMQEDPSTNRSAVISADGFTTDAVADTVAPVLSNPVAAANGETENTGSVSTDEANGTLRWVVSRFSTQPSVAQITAGQDHTGANTDESSAQLVSATGLQTITGRDLFAGITYYIHYVHIDASGNESAIVTSSSFTTAGGSSSGGGGGGGGGGGSDEIEISSISALSTSVTITGTIDDDAENMYVVLSTSDSTIFCSDADDEGYTTVLIPGTFESDESFSVTVTNLTASIEYYFIVCGEVDGDDEKSDTESFTTAAAGAATPVTTSPVSTTPATPVTTTIPVGYSFDTNISFIQPSVNDPEAVRLLALFLNEFENENLVVDNVHSAADDAAVKRFQLKYRREILDVWNLTEATGYVGITTRLKINFLLKGQAAQCPAFIEYNGGRDGIFNSPEVAKTKEILAKLGMYTGPIDTVWTPQTNDAMVIFQETFREVMLDPWNITKGTGYKYKTTNKFLNYFAGCDTGAVELEGVGVYEGL